MPQPNVLSEAQQALRTYLVAWSLLPYRADGITPAVKLQNRIYDPTVNEIYIREYLLPGDSDRMSIGPKSKVRDTALWQLGVFSPAGVGSGNSNMADGLKSYFWPGLQLTTLSGLTLTVRKSWRSNAIEEPDWWHTPVTVKFIIDSLTP